MNDRGSSGRPGSNILHEALGDLPTNEQLIRRLTKLPELPRDVRSIPVHHRPYLAESVRKLHIPATEELNLARTVDLRLNHGYSIRDPAKASSWRYAFTDEQAPGQLLPVPGASTACLLGGVSGTGKSEAIEQVFSSYPWAYCHLRFPQMASGVLQLLHLKVLAPPSGRLKELVEVLVRATAEATGDRTLLRLVAGDKFDARRVFAAWRRYVSSRFLGVVAIDEVNNLFKIPALKSRAHSRRDQAEIELRVVEDETLKMILDLCNAGIAVLCSGTPDGIAALSKRFSILQRSTDGGYHYFEPLSASALEKTVLPVLLTFQWSDEPMVQSPELVQILLKTSGGIRRILIGHWIKAHRVAADRNERILTLDHFRIAAQTYMQPVRPAVEALLSDSPDRLRRYEDLIRAVRPI